MRKRRLLVETERLPGNYFEHGRDWSDFAISRVLAEPLFSESSDRGMRTSIVRSLQRQSDVDWKLELFPSEDDVDVARIVCKQVYQASVSGGVAAAAASMIKRLRPVSKHCIILETRFPIAHLERILAHPGLSPHAIKGFQRYTISEKSETRMLLEPRHGTRSIELIQRTPSSKGSSIGSKLRGPMALNPAEFASRETANERLFNLDICYALSCPSSLPLEMRQAIDQGIDRERLASSLLGLVRPCSRLTEMWDANNALPGDTGCNLALNHNTQATALRYSDFPGNADLANIVSGLLNEQFGIQLRTHCVSYEALLTGSDNVEAYEIVLIAPAWPHPTSALAPYYFSADSSAEFKQEFRDAIRQTDLKDAAQVALSAENHLVEAGRRLIVLAQVNGCFWPLPKDFFCPPSGWIDLETLAMWGEY